MHDVSVTANRWRPLDAERLYRVREWGSDYFQISDTGDLQVALSDESAGKPQMVSLAEAARQIVKDGASLPAVLHFPSLFKQRIEELHQCFENAITKLSYSGHYRGVFPIKVNQKRGIVREVTSYCQSRHYGLEVGSKAELLAALGSMSDHEAYLSCNGYKDEAYIRLALMGRKAGLNVVLVVEMLSEIPAILKAAKDIGVTPSLGIRYRLSKTGSGRWGASNGDAGLFGLSGLEVIRAIDMLKEADALAYLQMLHFHQGSQLGDLRGIRSGVEEASRVYADLVGEGAPLGALNLGGGLAIDYDGTQTASQGSMNYSLEDYCEALVSETAKVMDAAGVPHPTLVTESGRGVCAHSSVLVFEVFDAKAGLPEVEEVPIPEDAQPRVCEIADEIAALLTSDPEQTLNKSNPWRCELQELFSAGQITLREVTAIERLFQECAQSAADADVAESTERRSCVPDIVYGNFSVFQSLPDHWALGQIFPVMPLHRHDERPSRQGVLADLTCDSDGKIRTYIPSEEAESLPIHDIRENEPYLFGAFLVGAYQETLGDKHNLFGTPNIISITIESGRPKLSPTAKAETVGEILETVGYDTDELREAIRILEEKSASGGNSHLSSVFAEALSKNTYLAPAEADSD